MLSSLFSTIQSTLGLSKNFIISYLLPLLLFLGASAGILYGLGQPYRGWIAHDLPKEGGWLFAGSIIAITALAYVFSALGTLMRELLEGRHVLELSWFRGGLYERQRRKLDTLTENYTLYADRLAHLRVKEWKNKLKLANDAGRKTHKCVYAPTKATPGYKTFQKVCRQRLRDESVESRELEAAVNFMEAELRDKSTDKSTAAGKKLSEDYGRLRGVLEYAEDRYAYEQNEWFKRRQFHFPGVFRERNVGDRSSPSNMLAVTSMGNIARTIRSYSLNRYSLDLDVLWSRLQTVIQEKKKDFFGSLQDAKTQLDFIISLSWLTALFWITWAILIPVLFDVQKPGAAYALFAVVMVGGPLLTWTWYKLACQSYAAFADLMRTSVDLCRFELLDALRLPRPVGTAEENARWEAIAGWIGFDNDKPGFEYERDKK